MADTPTDHDRIVTLEAHVHDLRQWRDTLTAHLDQKFDAIDATLDTHRERMETHVDTGFAAIRQEMQGTLDRLRLALPTWAQIALYALIGLLGVAATLVVSAHP